MTAPTPGDVSAEVTTGIVKLFRDYYGRGPVRAKTHLFDNYALTILEDTLTVAETTLVKSGREEMVRDFRIAFQTEMAEPFKGVVERATGRKVVTYQSQIAFHPDACFEIFILDGPPAALAAESSANG